MAGTIFAGGVFSWFVTMPAIKFFGGLVPTPIYPGTVPIAELGPMDLWRSYIRYIGAGAVAAAGLITLMKTLPTIVAALRAGMGTMRQGAPRAAPRFGGRPHQPRLPDDRPARGVRGHRPRVVVADDVQPVPGAATSWYHNIIAAILVVIFGFLFVTVSSRICGLIGTSANPVSGMTIATLMATCASSWPRAGRPPPMARWP